MRKTLAQQSCLQPKGPVRHYRPDAEAPDAPLRIAVLSIGQRHSLRVGPGCRPAQRKFRTSRMPSRADVRGEFFFALVMFHSAWSQAADQYPHLSNRSGPRLRRTYTIPTLNHISPWASPCRPPWLRCYLSRALVRIAGAHMHAVLTLGRVDVRDQLDVAARAFSSG